MGCLKEKRIGVLMGGTSAEREISLKSGRAVADALERLGYHVVSIDVDPTVADRLRRERIDVAFIALHGLGGEDGSIQGLLEIMGIPYTGSGVLASAIGMDKAISKALLMAEGIPTPRAAVVRAENVDDALQAMKRAPLTLPVVVKPSAQGSTLGVSVVQNFSDITQACHVAATYGDRVIIEEYINGREYTVAIVGETPLPVIEILFRGALFDFETKYEHAAGNHAVIARLSSDLTTTLQQLALRAHRVIGCRGATRVDIRVDHKDHPFVLEINTIPGMTSESLLPLAARQAGIDYETLVQKMLCAVEGGGS